MLLEDYQKNRSRRIGGRKFFSGNGVLGSIRRRPALSHADEKAAKIIGKAIDALIAQARLGVPENYLIDRHSCTPAYAKLPSESAVNRTLAGRKKDAPDFALPLIK
jgi:hypothetical protein